MKTKSAATQCPTCRKEGDWFAGPYGPFCSRRCKLVDLGKWFAEEHEVSRPLSPAEARQADDDDPAEAA